MAGAIGRYFIAISLFLSGCAGLAGRELENAYAAKYVSDGDTELTFENDTSLGPSAMFYMPQGLSEDLGEILGSPLKDCSSGQHRCLEIPGLAVFAASSDRTFAGQTFKAFDATIRVIGCADAVCSLALLSSHCAYWNLDKDGLEECSAERSASGRGSEGWTMYYLHDRQRGILMFGVDLACPDAVSVAHCSTLHGYKIQSTAGLLSSR